MQEKWLNKMARKGHQLIRTDRLLYEFEKCEPGKVEYRIDFVGQKSKRDIAEYRSFLEDFGYKVFSKNINLNYSIGKVRYRPWAENGGRIATNATTFNKELLIVEKEADGKDFELHTSYEDQIIYNKSLRKPWLYLMLIFAIFGLIYRSLVYGGFAVVALIPVIVYQLEIIKIHRSSKAKEW